jgi:hypothetical protein
VRRRTDRRRRRGTRRVGRVDRGRRTIGGPRPRHPRLPGAGTGAGRGRALQRHAQRPDPDVHPHAWLPGIRGGGAVADRQRVGSQRGAVDREPGRRGGGGVGAAPADRHRPGTGGGGDRGARSPAVRRLRHPPDREPGRGRAGGDGRGGRRRVRPAAPSRGPARRRPRAGRAGGGGRDGAAHLLVLPGHHRGTAGRPPPTAPASRPRGAAGRVPAPGGRGRRGLAAAQPRTGRVVAAVGGIEHRPVLRRCRPGRGRPGGREPRVGGEQVRLPVPRDRRGHRLRAPGRLGLLGPGSRRPRPGVRRAGSAGAGDPARPPGRVRPRGGHRAGPRGGRSGHRHGRPLPRRRAVAGSGRRPVRVERRGVRLRGVGRGRRAAVTAPGLLGLRRGHGRLRPARVGRRRRLRPLPDAGCPVAGPPGRGRRARLRAAPPPVESASAPVPTRGGR